MSVEPSRDWAEAADHEDPLAELRERFHIPVRRGGAEPSIYLVGNSLGCMPRGVDEDLARELEDWRTLGVDAHLEGRDPWYTYHEPLREPGARLVGAKPGEVCFMNSLTVNLHLMMASFYCPTPGRYKIVIERSAFPSDRYAARSQIRLHGFDPSEALVQLDAREGERTLRDEDIEAYLGEHGGQVALVLLPGVNYLTGQVFDMARITRAARSAGCRVGWDLAHAAGNIPLTLHEDGADFACWCSYKYLNAGPGAVAGCFVHERHHSDTDLVRLAGWWGNDPATRFEMREEFSPVPSADAWQLSNPPVFSMTPLRKSLALFDRATMDALRAKSLRMGAFARAMIERRLGSRIEVVTPAEGERSGCQLSLEVGERAAEIHGALCSMGILTDLRNPGILRAAPVPLYNTFMDVYGLIEGLDRALGG